MNELNVAQQVRDGELPSPQKVGGFHLVALRITGTGFSKRGSTTIYRVPEDYLNDSFLARCNGLPVIMGHVEDGKGGNTGMLDAKSFKEQAVGSVILPYIKGNEVWGVAKVYDEDFANNLAAGDIQMSTSPLVVTGEPVYVDGTPDYLDHIAFVPNGVWDKGGAPSGVRVDNKETLNTMKESKADGLLDPLAIVPKADEDKEESKDDEDKEESKADEDKETEEESKADEDKETEEESKADEDKETEDESKADEDKEESKADSMDLAKADSVKAQTMNEIESIKKELEALRAQVGRANSDSELNKLGEIQAKADSVGREVGVKVPAPYLGEKALEYRKRILSDFAGRIEADSAMTEEIESTNSDFVLNLLEEKIFGKAKSDAATKLADSAKNKQRGRYVEIENPVTGFKEEHYEAVDGFIDFLDANLSYPLRGLKG